MLKKYLKKIKKIKGGDKMAQLRFLEPDVFCFELTQPLERKMLALEHRIREKKIR